MSYFAATDISLSMSGGPVGGVFSLISATKCSSSPGVHCSSTLAGPLPSTPKAVRDLTGSVDEGPWPLLHFLVAAQKGHLSLDHVECLILGVMHVPG